MANYKILEGEGLESKVEKTDFSSVFTMQAVKDGYNAIKKQIKELEAQKRYEEAQKINIENNYKELIDTIKILDDKSKVAIFLYIQADAKARECEEKISEYNGAISEYDDELVIIKEQTGVDIFEPVEEIKEETNE